MVLFPTLNPKTELLEFQVLPGFQLITNLAIIIKSFSAVILKDRPGPHVSAK